MTRAAKAVFLAATMLAGAAQAQETLIFATTNPEQHQVNQNVLIPWAERVTEASNGALEIDLRHGPMMANHTNFYDRVMDDVVQIAWGMTVFNPGRFPRSLVSTLPFLVESAEQGSVAICEMHERGAFDEEFSDIVPLFFVEFPQAAAHLNGAPVAGMADLAGKKVITSSPAAAAIVAGFEGAPLSFGITEQFEALQRGAADGTVLNFTTLPGFRLNEVLTDHYVIPMGGVMAMVFMEKTRFEALSEEARQAIMSNSGCDASRAAGQYLDQWEAESLAFVEAEEGHTITRATPEDVQALVETLGPGIEADFAQKVPGGADLIAMFKEELAAATE